MRKLFLIALLLVMQAIGTEEVVSEASSVKGTLFDLAGTVFDRYRVHNVRIYRAPF